MKHIKSAALVSGVVGGALLLAGQAMADPITVDGIQFTEGAIFQSANLYENVVSESGEELMGYGIINTINGMEDYCASGGPLDCELTFVFEGYTAETVNPQYAVFNGGEVRFYADSTADFDASIRSTAVDGELFLATVGHEYLDTDSGRQGTLLATGSNLTTAQAQGNGVGYLDVVGGSAAEYFNTDTFDDFLGGTTDIQFNSTFSPNSCDNTTTMPICGTSLVKGEVPTASVPEPSALGLMGLSLVGLGFAIRRRRRD